jgi:hypothetical protein
MQCVVWDDTSSSLIEVKYGVRQGSILRPILSIILVNNMAGSLGIGDGENVVYADDSNVWQTEKDVDKVVRKLTEKASNFADCTQRMGLSMNGSKTQLLLSANAGNVADVTMMVDRKTISPSVNIKLLVSSTTGSSQRPRMCGPCLRP